jgi:hypothetical protein
MAEYTADPGLDVAPIQTPNLLTDASQSAGLIGQMNQNQQFAAQKAQSNLLTQATNPDGSINVPKYQQMVAQNPQAASVGAGDAFSQAQELNQKLLANTGQSLTQHFTRLSAASDYLQTLNIDNNGAGISKADGQSAVVEALKQGIIDPTEAANMYTSFGDDPKQNANFVRQTEAGVNQSLAAITPAYQTLSTPTGSLPVQTNAGASGGANIPAVTGGFSPDFLAHPYQWTNAQNQPVNGTIGQYLAQSGVPVTGPQIGGGVGGGSTNQAPGQMPQMPQANQPPLPVIGGQQAPAAHAPQIGAPQAAQGGIQPPTPAQVAAMGNNTQPVPAQAPGAGGQAQFGPAPGLADVQKQNTDTYNADISTGTNLAPKISALQELAAAAPGAQTGPAANELAMIRGLGQQFGINVGTDQASQEQVMNKATNMLVTSGLGLSGIGTPTDAKMLELVGATPNSKMTPDAVKSTVAMTYGQTLYQQNLANAAQAWVNRGGSPTQYNQFKLQYQQTAPSPLVLSMPYMPPSALLSVGKYIKTLPKSDQQTINAQIATMQHLQNTAGQQQNAATQ